MSNPIQDSSSTNLPWWHRPIGGKEGLLNSLLNNNQKQEIPEEILTFRQKQMLDIRIFAKTAQFIDSDKFGSEEFLTYVRIKYLLSKGIGEFAGLGESSQLLQFAIDAKDLFISIDHIEIRYRSAKQQEFYQFVEELLKAESTVQEFRIKVLNKSEEIMPFIKTDEGCEAMQVYTRNLEKVSENPLGLELLALFKTFQLADYSILRTIADYILNIESKHAYDIRALVNFVNANLNLFEKLRNIIKLSETLATPQAYAVMVQYIILFHQHAISYLKFEDLMKVLREWNCYYQNLLQIATEYPETDYAWPQEWKEPIPGETQYLKYQKWLTDPKTGMVYYDLC